MVELAGKVNIVHQVDPTHVNIEKDPFHPTAYIINLPLDSEPSYVWHTLFTTEMSASLDFWDRKVLLTGRTLRLATTTDHLTEKLHWLEQVVIATNKRVDEYNKRARAQEEAMKTKLVDEDLIRKEISSWQISRVRA